MANFDNIDIKVFTEKSQAEIISELEVKAESIDLELDEGNSGITTKIFDITAHKEFTLTQSLNHEAKQCFVIFATGDALDAHGASFSTPRNITIDEDGNEVKENDESYRQRILLALEKITNAGTKKSYEYHTRAVSADILDAQATSPEPGKVAIYIKSFVEDKGALEQQVYEYINQDDIKAITDKITVSHGQAQTIDFHAKIYALANPIDETIIQARKEDLIKYFKKNEKLKATISIAGIFDALHDNNIRKIDLISPSTNLEFKADEYPVLGNVDLQVIYE